MYDHRAVTLLYQYRGVGLAAAILLWLSIGGASIADDSSTTEGVSAKLPPPPYVFLPRPRITSAPAAIRYGRNFRVVVDELPAEAVLISLGSMTHSIDMNQRYVEVEIRHSVQLMQPQLFGNPQGTQPQFHYLTSIKAPADPRIAPPGYYMLFVLNSQLAPSEAKIVRLR